VSDVSGRFQRRWATVFGVFFTTEMKINARLCFFVLYLLISICECESTIPSQFPERVLLRESSAAPE
jgi:hypothetical protein